MAGKTKHPWAYLDHHIPSNQRGFVTGSYDNTGSNYFHGDYQSSQTIAYMTKADGKVCIFYAALALEGSAVWAQVLFSPHFQIDANRIGQRYGAFTLIIL